MSQESTATGGDPFIGRMVAGRYRVVDALARGGMGRVYRAVQEPLGREIALKVLDIQELKDTTGSDEAGKGFADRFFLEAASVAKLSHPNTITVHDYGTMDDGACFIAMELLHGRTLGELISADAPLAPGRVQRIALQVCASLSEAHLQGLTHRDLKPANIMLIEHGADREFVKVLDFGLVKRENDNSDLTASGALVGTPKYMAPEQVTGQNVGPWSDVYALGAVMYHMLTGEPPFIGDSKFALLAAHMNVELDPMSEKVPGLEVPPALEAVVRRCMAKVPKERFASMQELAEALVLCGDASALPLSSSLPSSDSLRILLDSGVLPPSTSSGERPIARPAGGPVEPEALSAAEAPSPRRAWLLFTMLLVAVVAGSAFVFSRPDVGATAGEPVARHEAGPTPPPGASSQPGVTGPIVPEHAAPNQDVAAPEVANPVAHQARVLLASEPSGAHARRGEFDLGDTPVTLVIPEGETWTIRLSAPGYSSRTVTATAGQGEVRARLTRGRRPHATPVASPVAETMTETMTETMVAPTVSMTSGHTDNRDPWATP